MKSKTTTNKSTQLSLRQTPSGQCTPKGQCTLDIQHSLPLPTAEELFPEMHNANFFTKLDPSSGYWQIKVDEESSKLLTFSTPFGRLQFKRLPYGIHSASEVSQQDIEEIIEGCEGARNSQDDIIIGGRP